MKNLLPKVILLVAISTSANAATRNVVFGGASFGEDNSYYYLGGVSAVNGDLDRDDLLLRASVGYGKYNYRAPALVEEKESGQVSSTDLMVGYQKYFSTGRVSVFGGANYDDYRLHKNDPSNRVNGGKFGAKGQFELMLDLTKELTFNNISSYSSAYNSYWISNSVAWNFDKFSFGPEMIFIGNTSFDQQRIGGQFSRINFGSVALSLSGGYLKSAGKAGDDGYYTSIGLASRF
jgi:hypothetical protein